MGSTDTTATLAAWSGWALNGVTAYAAPTGNLTDNLANILTDNLGNPLAAGSPTGNDFISLNPGQLTGTAVSGWRASRTRTVAKVPSIVSNIPAGFSLVTEYQTSPDMVSVSPWVTDIKATPDAAWIQYRHTLKAGGTGTPEVDSTAVYPV